MCDLTIPILKYLRSCSAGIVTSAILLKPISVIIVGFFEAHIWVNCIFFLHYVPSHLDRMFLFVEEKANNSADDPKKRTTEGLALFPFLPAMISNKWDVRALDR